MDFIWASRYVGYTPVGKSVRRPQNVFDGIHRCIECNFDIFHAFPLVPQSRFSA